MTTAHSKELSSLVERLYAELRPEAIAEIYCDYGGEEFWRSRRETVRDLGITWAEALVSRLKTGGSSLYVGAGIAELPAMLIEVRSLGRRMSVANLRDGECAELNRALRAVGVGEDEISFQARDAAEIAQRCRYDHLSLVSVLNDPELYPLVSDMAYGRISPVLLDLAAFAAERDKLHALVDVVCGGLALPGLVTTSYEEVPWILHWAERRSVQVDPDEVTIESAVVGDPIGFLRLRA